MTDIEQQIIDTWFINHRTNLLLLDSITEEALGLSCNKRGGSSVGHQLAHIYNIRFWKLEKWNKTLVAHLTTIKAEDTKTIAMLKECHNISAELIGQVLAKAIADGGKMKGFKRGVVPFLGSFIHHEAHHRGNIVLTLKLSGFTLPTALKYGIWEWDKI